MSFLAGLMLICVRGALRLGFTMPDLFAAIPRLFNTNRGNDYLIFVRLDPQNSHDPVGITDAALNATASQLNAAFKQVVFDENKAPKNSPG